MRSPDRKLLPREIARKKKKLSKTLNQLEGLTEGTKKHHRKSFKAEKTLDQVTTGKSGIRPNKSALNMLGVSRNEYGESRGEGHDGKQRFRYDQADKNSFNKLNQKTKDSLQGEAYKYDKPFFSPKYGVNVDPEDGVLSNRPIYSDNTKLTYDKIDKPFSKSGMNRNETQKDSLGHDAAWAKWEKGYMDRTHKMKGTKFEKPITPEENKKEMEMERGEFMYDKGKGQIRLRKTDDAERPLERKSKKKNPKLKAGKNANYSRRDKDSYFYDYDYAEEKKNIIHPTRKERIKKIRDKGRNEESKTSSPINLNDPYAGQYEAGAGGGADYFSNAEDFQKLFSNIGDAFSKAYTPENRAKYQEKRANRREERGKKKHPKNTLEAFNVKDKQGQPIGENKDRIAFEKKTQDIRDKAAKNRAKALLSKKKKDQNT
jgi:hypothetical protein